MARNQIDRDRRDPGSRRNPAGIALRRLLGLVAFLPLASRAPDYARLIVALVRDDRTPAERKAILAAAVGYLLFGRDLVDDEIPVLGGLDDVIVVVLAVDLFLDGVPDHVLDETLVRLGIDDDEFRDDVARIRRLTPGPVRRTIRRIPGLAEFALSAVRRTGLGPRARPWTQL